MELPAEVLVHNALVGAKGSRATLIRISDEAGYYELNMNFGEGVHRVLMPVDATVLIARDPEAAVGTIDNELER